MAIDPRHARGFFDRGEEALVLECESRRDPRSAADFLPAFPSTASPSAGYLQRQSMRPRCRAAMMRWCSGASFANGVSSRTRRVSREIRRMAAIAEPADNGGHAVTAP